MDLPEKTLRILHISEPLLDFGHGQSSEHPKDGLFLYGPHEGAEGVKGISVGVIGTHRGLQFFSDWKDRLSGHVRVPPPKKHERKDRIHLSDFPGFAAAYGITIDSDLVTKAIGERELDEATRTLNHHEAVSKAVDLYVREIVKHDENEEHKVDVWVLVLPELVFERCKPQSQRTGLGLVKGGFGKKQSGRQSLPLLADVVDQSEETIFDDLPDFHRQVKARLLKINYTSQLVRETTLAPHEFLNAAGYEQRKLQEPATVAWNLATGLYYKTQPRPPWRLSQVREGVCYIGLAFKALPNNNANHACCAAQMFLTEGDGVVFRGANGPWKTDNKEYHLKSGEAKSLIGMVIDTFDEMHDAPPKELFIHGKTTFSDSEWEGFVESASSETNVVGIRIKETHGEVKLFRDGDYPVLRGTAMILDERNAYLWTNGFLPRLDTYIGPETPNPLFVTLLRSSGLMPPIETVLADIVCLTKINYNACNFSDGLPVTLRFADKVGDILTMGSAKDAKKQPFKFYV